MPKITNSEKNKSNKTNKKKDNKAVGMQEYFKNRSAEFHSTINLLMVGNLLL